MPYKDPAKAKESSQKRGKAWRLRNLEAQRIREKEVKRIERVEKPTKARDQARVLRKEKPEKVRALWRKWKYGLSQEQYDALLLRQEGVCAICKSSIKLVVDHDHETEKVRGLLCDPCNRMLGIIKENTTTLANAIIYINEHKKVGSAAVDKAL